MRQINNANKEKDVDDDDNAIINGYDAFGNADHDRISNKDGECVQ